MSTTTQTTAPTFKSSRAAKMAFTKVEQAWEAKRAEKQEARAMGVQAYEVSGTLDTPEADALKATGDRAEREADALFEEMRLIWEGAAAQELWITSRHFGPNATREIVAANMD